MNIHSVLDFDMARKKVKLAWISNDKARRATFKKRKKGLVKKVRELSTLCGVGACLIVFGPYDPKPEIWPENSSDLLQVISRFKSLPAMEKSKKMISPEALLRQSVAKMREQLARIEKENREARTANLLSLCLGGKGLQDVSMEELSDLAWLVEAKEKAVNEKIELLRRQLPVEMKTMKEEDERISLEAAMEALQRQQWFMEVMNSHAVVGCGWEEMAGPYVDPNLWLDPLFLPDL